MIYQQIQFFFKHKTGLKQILLVLSGGQTKKWCHNFQNYLKHVFIGISVLQFFVSYYAKTGISAIRQYWQIYWAGHCICQV